MRQNSFCVVPVDVSFTKEGKKSEKNACFLLNNKYNDNRRGFGNIIVGAMKFLFPEEGEG